MFFLRVLRMSLRGFQNGLVESIGFPALQVRIPDPHGRAAERHWRSEWATHKRKAMKNDENDQKRSKIVKNDQNLRCKGFRKALQRHLFVLATSNAPWDLDEALRRRLEKRRGAHPKSPKHFLFLFPRGFQH